MQSPRITKVEAFHRTDIVLHLSDGSVIEMVPVQTSGSIPDLDVQQTVLVALQDLLRGVSGGEGRSWRSRPEIIAANRESFARQELESFFRRREERGKFYCVTCLAEQLIRRGSSRIAPPAWLAALEETFACPSRKTVRLGGRCETCQKPKPTIGPQDPETVTS